MSDIDERRGRGLGNPKLRDEATRRAAMRNSHGVVREALVPLTYALRNGLITLSSRRNEMPLVLLACGDALRIADMQLCDRKAFPVAERDFAKAHFHPIAVGG